MTNRPDSEEIQEAPKNSPLIPVFTRKLPQRQPGESKRKWAKRAVASLKESPAESPLQGPSGERMTQHGTVIPAPYKPKRVSREEALAQFEENRKANEADQSR